MPVFKSYSADGNLLEVIDEPLSANNIERFIKEYGDERAKIYLEALAEFTAEMDAMRFRDIGCGARAMNTPQKMKTQIINLYHRNQTLLDLSQVKAILMQENPTP